MRRLALIAALLLAALTRPAFAVTNGLSADYSKGVVLLGSPAGAANCKAAVTGAIRYNSSTSKVESCNGTSWSNVGGTVSPAGADKQVQWNNNGTLAASSGLTFDSTKLALAIGSISGANAPTTANYSEMAGNSNSATVAAGSTVYGPADGAFTMSTTVPSAAANAEISMVSRAATVQNLYYLASAANGSGKTNTITVYKNGASTTLTCSVTNATTCSDIADSVTVAPGDWLSVKIVTAASSTAVTHTWSIELSY